MRIESPPQQDAAAPLTVELDADWDFSPLAIVAAMTWPRSARRRAEATATFAAQMLSLVEAFIPTILEKGLSHGIAEFAARIGVTPAEVLSMPHARRVMAEALRAGAEVQAEFRSRIEHELFRPAGGFHMVAAAPGAAVLTDEIRKAAERGGFVCGFLLLTVVRLATFHPELPASLNRAYAVLEAWRAANPAMRLPADRKAKDAWREFEGIAPLWAAMILSVELAVRGAPDVEEAWQAFGSASARRQMIGWAKWFRRFAVSYTPRGATKPLISEREAVLITGGVPEQEPPLGPLPQELLKAAAAYRAPKSFY